MTPEIEKRIKAVQAGRVPAGYKRTKVGIVPKEWDELKLSHYLSVSKEKNTELKYSKEDVFSISGELGIVNQIELLGRSYAGVSVAPYGVVKPNDVVYTKSPLKANPYGIIKTNKTGKTGIVSTLYAIFNCKNNVNPIFVQYYFESDKNLNDYLHPIVNIGAKHDMKISDENSLSGIVIFPPLSEQKKIAEILATQDRVIELKEKLIAEKQCQKKYLMSVLLGDDFKKPFKLNGVTIDKKKWEITKINSVIKKVDNPVVVNKENQYTQIGIYSHGKGLFYKEPVTGKELGNKSVFWIEPNCFILNIVFAWEQAVAKTTEKEKGFIASHRFPMFKPIDNLIDVDYAVYYFLTKKGTYILDAASPGGAGRNRTLGQDRFLESKILLPSLPEQEAIAKVLSAADEEISLLQKDLEQEKLKKKSLMQLLLTGLVRVQ
ncbi:restriction endonuclease subunit S [Fibrobacter succinogenes]|uniref:restriction endonuclease subunit S n=1 Tax=Fibrobacter succinogenes TaxID=833 RepID=UPI0015696295|nr:restriction endonuclease subunit S [Fibrobacter succinogenes]